MYIGFWWGNLREGDHLEDPGVGEGIILKLMLMKRDGVLWTAWIWLRVGTGAERL